MRILCLILCFCSFLWGAKTLISLESGAPSLHIKRPSPPGRKLVFFILGDFGLRGTPQLKVARLMEKRCQKHKNIDGILTVGDNFYPNGIKSVKDPLLKELFEKPYTKRCLKRVPFYPSLGNHDYKGNPQAQVDYSKQNLRWQMPHRFYTLNFGNFLKLIVYDSNRLDFCLHGGRCALDFLFKEVYENESQWLLVSSHHPLTSASKKEQGHYTGDNIQSFLLRKLACSSVDAWLSGHSHHLEQRALEGCPTQFFISGAGGAGLNHPHKDQKESLFVEDDYGFLELEIEEEQMTSRFFTKKGLLYEKKTKKSLKRN